MRHSQHLSSSQREADEALLHLLTAPSPPSKSKVFARRDAALDPLLIAAAAASGPHITRNHYHHDFFPGVMLPEAEGSWDWTKWTGEDISTRPERKSFVYVSRQAPRRQRIQGLDLENTKENDHPRETNPLKPAENLPPLQSKKRRSSISAIAHLSLSDELQSKTSDVTSSSLDDKLSGNLVQVKCMARTRIPTPHGPAFLHLYHNNRDNKEHLAIVIDPAQLSDNHLVPAIRSKTLDAVWSREETEMDRIIRGAYVGRLSPSSQQAFEPKSDEPNSGTLTGKIPPPLIRIHSECFTGETVGSMRCDCGEQLDEAIRLISEEINISSLTNTSLPSKIPGRGAVIYLRQEGRGIGLLSKIRAYNLQDMGHDTVTANLMLGHKADERGYEIAAAILRDLGLGSDQPTPSSKEGVRVLTNNPDKVEALQKEGIKVAERVPMIPRSWKKRQQVTVEKTKSEVDGLVSQEVEQSRVLGATLIGGKTVYGEDLDKYLRTKVLRMGHMLPLWMEDSDDIQPAY